MAVRFGILGPGNIARRFAKTLTSNEVNGAELAAVASREGERAKAFAEEFGAARFYGGYDGLAADAGVDVVYIATTNNAHFENVSQMLAAGKNVLCEKPLAMTKAEALALAELARAKGVLLMEAMWTRCLPAVRKAKEWVDTGRIGKVGFIDASFAFNAGQPDPTARLFDPTQGGGALYDGGVYPIEFITGIAGKPDAVHAQAVAAPTGVDALTAVSLKYNSGIVAQGRCALLCAAKNDAHIYGTGGFINVYSMINARVCELYAADGSLAERFESDFADGFCYEINHVVSLVKDGKTDSDLVPIGDSIDCAEIFDRCMGLFAASAENKEELY